MLMDHRINTVKMSILTKAIYKYLGINLPKETKKLYIESNKTLMREIKMTQIDGEIDHIHDSEESM